MIIDITNDIVDRLESELSNITVLTSYPETTPVFPVVTIDEISNVEDYGSIDSSGGHYSQIAIEINIYTNSSKKVSEAKGIRKLVDTIVADDFGLTRDFSSTVPNYLDESIYRYTMRYSCSVDSNKVIYRR